MTARFAGGCSTACELRRGRLTARAWEQEAARYIETYKQYESKPADAIQGRTEPDYLSRLTAALTTVRGINRTDVLTLGGALRSMAGIMQARPCAHGPGAISALARPGLAGDQSVIAGAAVAPAWFPAPLDTIVEGFVWPVVLVARYT